MAKLILTLPGDTPSLRTAPISTDPTTSDYTAFSIYHNDTGELLSTFRADDIVQQQGFMAALGGRGPGLFSQQPQQNSTPLSIQQPALQRQQTYAAMSQNSQRPEICKKVPKTYQEALQKFPSEFYFSNFELPTPRLPGVELPDVDPSQVSLSSVVPRIQIKTEFRPPHGPPINYHSMIGCGAAAGLELGQIAVWDHENEFYYFLDSNHKMVFACEPRQRPSYQPTVQKSQITVHRRQAEKMLTLPSCAPALVRATAERASRRPHGCVLRACGKNGRNGMSAISAANGTRGNDGARPPVASLCATAGGDGGDGTPGRDGRHAEAGEDGGIGKNVIVELYGDARELGIAGTCQSVARLSGEDCEEVLLVDCSGGDGGDGGDGGAGGRGGDGGDGGGGRCGGDGGHGGDGGEGGRGGNGGNAGCGGRGGNCVIRSADPRLLMLVEVDCDSGRPGRVGKGGRGGSGGKMGLGGASSNEGPLTMALDTFSGLQGKPGMSGRDVEDGIDGMSGFTHRAGHLQWVITTPDGEMKHSSTTCFEAEVLSMSVSPCSRGSVFEPHQQIQVTDIIVVNSGGLPLPAGAKVSIPSTDSVRFEPTTYSLPGLEPGEQFVVPAVFRGRIVDEPSPNVPGPFSHACRFTPRIDLLGRPFEKSHLEHGLAVQYPIKLAYALGEKNVCQGKVTTLEVGIENTSSVPYGACNDSGGSVLVHILLDPSLHPLGLAPEPPTVQPRNGKTGRNSPGRGFVASHDSNSIFIQISDLQPSSTLNVPIVVQVGSDAELGATCRWQVEVYLRGKLIEYNSAEMQVSPKYSTGDSSQLQLADVLLVKTDNLDEREMQFWQRIFELLEVSYDYWDTSHAASSDSSTSSGKLLPPFQQEYSGKLVIVPHCDITKLTVEDIVTHFKADSPQNGSSMLLFLDTPAPDSLEQYIQHNEGNKRVLQQICANEKLMDISPELYSGCHLVSPGSILSIDMTLERAQKSVLKKLERDLPSHAPLMVGQSGALRRQGMTYSYGKLNVKRCPLPRTANFQCIDGAASQMIEMGADDPHLTTESKTIPLASNFGQVFLATLAGLPLHVKLNLLRNSPDQTSPLFVEFCLPNGATVGKRELVAVCLARDIADEVWAESSDHHRMHKLTSHIKDISSSSSFAADDTIYPRLLDLIRREANQRQATLGKSVSQVVKRLVGLCTSTARHLSSSEQCSPLPHLSQLQSRLATLRPHQLTTDELFDLSH